MFSQLCTWDLLWVEPDALWLSTLMLLYPWIPHGHTLMAIGLGTQLPSVGFLGCPGTTQEAHSIKTFPWAGAAWGCEAGVADGDAPTWSSCLLSLLLCLLVCHMMDGWGLRCFV